MTDWETIEFSNCGWEDRIVIAETNDEICSCWGSAPVNFNRWSESDWGKPFRKGIERLVSGSCNDRNLIAPHCIYEAATLNNSLRSNEDEINFVHDIGHGRIQYHGARNTSSTQPFSCLNSVTSQYLDSHACRSTDPRPRGRASVTKTEKGIKRQLNNGEAAI